MRAIPPDPARAGTPYEAVSDEDFGDWGWQQRNRIESLEALEALLRLTEEERQGFIGAAPRFRFAISPYYALLADPQDPACPIRLQVVPRPEEHTVQLGERSDPLGEEELEAAPNLIHRYPDRALLLTTDRCPVYCRFCTRRRIVGRIERQAPRALLSEAFEYVRAHPEIKEVILSGGDALMLADAQLDYILRELRAIAHVDIIRVASRMPVTCPMRVTPALAEVLARYAPVYLMTHFNHPRECTRSAWEACARLVDRGVVIKNQTVLLRGINDRTEIIAELNRNLVAMRVDPHYLHQCDLAEGIEHFRTPLAVGLSIIDGLRGHMSGLAVPQFVVDVPGGLGKVTLQPEWVTSRQGRITTFRTYTGRTAEYYDP
ncbi:MAG: KamA family radical SAM protein [Myxococcota bacterium]